VRAFAYSSKNDFVAESNDDFGVGEGGDATGVAKLANRDEDARLEFRDNVDATCFQRELWDVEFCFVGRMHDAAVGAFDGHWLRCWSNVDNGCVESTEGEGAASVGYGTGGGWNVDGGGTYMSSRGRSRVVVSRIATLWTV